MEDEEELADAEAAACDAAADHDRYHEAADHNASMQAKTGAISAAVERVKRLRKANIHEEEHRFPLVQNTCVKSVPRSVKSVPRVLSPWERLRPGTVDKDMDIVKTTAASRGQIRVMQYIPTTPPHAPPSHLVIQQLQAQSSTAMTPPPKEYATELDRILEDDSDDDVWF